MATGMFTRGVLTQASEEAPTPAPNPEYAEALSAYSPQDRYALSQMLEATAKASGVPTLTKEQVGTILADPSDFLKDIHNGEPLTTRIQRGMPSLVNQVKTGLAEAEQKTYQNAVQKAAVEALEAGKELSQKQMSILEEQLGWSREAIDTARAQAKSGQVAQNELYRQAGLKPTYDEGGVLTGLDPMSEDELIGNMNPLQQQQYQIAKQTSQKQLDALAGKVDMDPALQESLKEQEQQLRAVLEQKLGPNYEKSTPGIQALSKFSEAKTRIEESARLSWIQTGQGLVTAAIATKSGEEGSRAGQLTTAAGTGAALATPLMNVPRQVTPGEVSGVLSTQMGGLSAAPTVFGGFQNVLTPMYSQTSYERQMEMIREQARQAESSASPWQGILTSLAGTAVSAGAAYMTGGLSLAATGAGGAMATSGPGAYSTNLPPPR